MSRGWRFWVRMVAACVGVVGLIAFGTLPSVDAAPGAQQVVVTNSAAQPVPVSGNVNVGNLPSTQTVAGSVTAQIDPELNQVRSADLTSKVLETVVTVPAPGGISTAVVGVAAAKQIRVSLQCFDCAAQDPISVSVVADGFRLDVIDFSTVGSCQCITRTYDTPGTSMYLVFGSTSDPRHFGVLVVRRSN